MPVVSGTLSIGRFFYFPVSVKRGSVPRLASFQSVLICGIIPGCVSCSSVYWSIFMDGETSSLILMFLGLEVGLLAHPSSVLTLTSYKGPLRCLFFWGCHSTSLLWAVAPRRSSCPTASPIRESFFLRRVFFFFESHCLWWCVYRWSVPVCWLGAALPRGVKSGVEGIATGSCS